MGVGFGENDHNENVMIRTNGTMKGRMPGFQRSCLLLRRAECRATFVGLPTVDVIVLFPMLSAAGGAMPAHAH
jgi:hypothetical protein